VDSNPELQLTIWQMTHSEKEHVTQQFQSHARDLSGVFDAIQLRATANHNVRITNSLGLKDNVIYYSSSWPLFFLTFSVKMAPEYPSHSGANKGSLSSGHWSRNVW